MVKKNPKKKNKVKKVHEIGILLKKGLCFLQTVVLNTSSDFIITARVFELWTNYQQISYLYIFPFFVTFAWTKKLQSQQHS